MKKGFTLVELLVVITIIGILANIGLATFTSAQIKSRDAKRKAHLKQLADAFEAYYNDHAGYPADDGAGNLDGFTWGTSQFSDANGTVYMVELPQDPTLGLTYYYDAAGSGLSFQLYAHLENDNDPALLTFTTPPDCGSQDCNYGVSSNNTKPEAGR